MTLHDLWTTTVRDHSSLPALGWVDETPWTYAEVDLRVQALQARFQGTGAVAAGDRIALWSANHPGWGVVYLAITTGPLVVVPILPDFTPREVANVLVHSGARVLVAGRALAEAWGRWLGDAPEPDRLALAGLRVEILEDLVEIPPTPVGPRDLPRPTTTDLAALVYTSGTTGASKGVMLTHGNLISNVLAAAPIPGLRAGDKMLSVLPLAHTYEGTIGFLIPLHKGCHISYLSKPPAPSVLIPALATVRPHAMLSVPLLMEKVYRQKVLPGLNKGLLRVLRKVPGLGWVFVRIAGAKLKKTFGGRMKFFGIGGAPLAPEVAQFLHQAGFPFAIGYGLTETSPLVAGHLKCRLYTTGRVLAGVTVKIGEPKDHRGAGEVLVKGPNVMAGYYKDPVRTAEAFTPDGWFKTGDLGLFDRGHLRLLGRSKNLILGPSGENIYPEAIEALINQDQMILESLVVQRGQEIIAKVELNYELIQEQTTKAIEAHLADLKDQINQQLARFSRLSRLEVQPEPFEKTATLKIKRYLYG